MVSDGAILSRRRRNTSVNRTYEYGSDSKYKFVETQRNVAVSPISVRCGAGSTTASTAIAVSGGKP